MGKTVRGRYEVKLLPPRRVGGLAAPTSGKAPKNGAARRTTAGLLLRTK